MQATGNVFAVSRAMGYADVKSMEPYQHPDTVTLNRPTRNANCTGRRHNLLRIGTQIGTLPSTCSEYPCRFYRVALG